MTPKKRLGHVPFCSPTPPDKCSLKGCSRTRIPPTSFCLDHQGMFRRDTCDNMPALPPYCETHKRSLRECAAGDASCAVCGCGGLCDPKERCPMARRPRLQEEARVPVIPLKPIPFEEVDPIEVLKRRP